MDKIEYRNKLDEIAVVIYNYDFINEDIGLLGGKSGAALFLAYYSKYKNDNKYLSIGSVLLKEDGKIDENLFRDGLHPNAKGYEKLGPQINEYLMRKLEKLRSPL